MCLLKVASHYFGFEVLELNTILTSLVAGTIFLIGFLVSGVLSDYKESEKLPSELAACLYALYDDIYTIFKSKQSAAALEFLYAHQIFTQSVMTWFYKKERTKHILNRIQEMNVFIIGMDVEGIQPNYIIKIKNEQNNLRKIFLRIDTIRDTTFVASAYVIVEFMSVLIGFCFLILKIEPFAASLFFAALVVFLLSYMIFLIKDLDNPFDYTLHGESGTEVSLLVLHNLENEINSNLMTKLRSEVIERN